MCLSICTCMSTYLCSVRQKQFHYILHDDVTKFILHEHILILDRRRIINASREKTSKVRSSAHVGRNCSIFTEGIFFNKPSKKKKGGGAETFYTKVQFFISLLTFLIIKHKWANRMNCHATHVLTNLFNSTHWELCTCELFNRQTSSVIISHFLR